MKIIHSNPTDIIRDAKQVISSSDVPVLIQCRLDGKIVIIRLLNEYWDHSGRTVLTSNGEISNPYELDEYALDQGVGVWIGKYPENDFQLHFRNGLTSVAFRGNHDEAILYCLKHGLTL